MRDSDLKKAHIQLKQQKMKVNLAAQSLSSSVADAIEYRATILKLPQFQGSEATVKFLRMFDHLASSVQTWSGWLIIVWSSVDWSAI